MPTTTTTSLNIYLYVNGNPLSYTDPTGEFGIVGAIGGAVFDIGFQLVANGGDWKCIDLKSTILGAGFGFFGPTFIGDVALGLNKTKKAIDVWNRAGQPALAQLERNIYKDAVTGGAFSVPGKAVANPMFNAFFGPLTPANILGESCVCSK